MPAERQTLAKVLLKARFWAQHAAIPFTARPQRLLHQLLNGLEGKLTSYRLLNKTLG